MKKILLVVFCIFLSIGLMGCDILDLVDEIEDADTLYETPGFDFEETSPDSRIGTGSGMHGDPYIVAVGETFTGNITDYVTGTPKLYYELPVEPGNEYTATLIVTETDADYSQFWVSILFRDGKYGMTDIKKLEGPELVGVPMEVTVTTETDFLDVIIEANALGYDVFYEFTVNEN